MSCSSLPRQRPDHRSATLFPSCATSSSREMFRHDCRWPWTSQLRMQASESRDLHKPAFHHGHLRETHLNIPPLQHQRPAKRGTINWQGSNRKCHCSASRPSYISPLLSSSTGGHLRLTLRVRLHELSLTASQRPWRQPTEL